MNTQPNPPELAASAPYAATVLRVSLGLMFLAHAVLLKLLTFGVAGTAGFFGSLGLPPWLGPLTIAVETVGGALLVLGVQTRWVALALAPVLLGAIVEVHAANGWLFTNAGGGWEYPAYLLVLCLAQAMLGDGALALRRSWTPARLRGAAPVAARA